MDRFNNIDPFDSMEAGNDRFMRAVRNIIAAATVIVGFSWLVWFWLIKP